MKTIYYIKVNIEDEVEQFLSHFSANEKGVSWGSSSDKSDAYAFVEEEIEDEAYLDKICEFLSAMESSSGTPFSVAGPLH